MAGKRGSADIAVFLVDGYNVLAAKPQGVTTKIEALMEPTHGLGDTKEAQTPTGLSRATLTQSGAFFDDSANSIHLLLSPAGATGVVRIVVFAIAGNAIGSRFTGFEGSYLSTYEVLGQVGKLTKANVIDTISGQKDDGVIVQSWTQKTITWNTKTDGFPVDFTVDTGQRVIPITSNSIANPTVVTTPVPHGLTTGDVILIAGVATSSPTINGQQTATVTGTNTFTVPINVTVGGTGGTFVRANTSGGADGYLEVSEMTGPTGFIGKIRASADDTTYADLITFANVTAAPAAQRLTVAGVIPRYLSFSGTVTGAGTITVFSGLSRN